MKPCLFQCSWSFINKFLNTIIILLSLTSISYSQSKITYGIGFDLFQTKINNLDRVNFKKYGLSVPGFSQNDLLGYGVSFLAKLPLSKRIDLESGLGISTFHSQFHFKYLNNMGNTKLNISLFYLNIPLFLTYHFPVTSSSAIHTSLGINTKFLFAYYDNFEKIINEAIGGQTGIDRYSQFVYSPQLNIGYSFKFTYMKSIRLDAMAGYDLNKFTNQNNLRGNWGFYTNVHPSLYSYYGMSLKYYFLNYKLKLE